MRRVPRVRIDDVSPASVLKRSAAGVTGHTLRWPYDWTGEAKSPLQGYKPEPFSRLRPNAEAMALGPVDTRFGELAFGALQNRPSSVRQN